MPSSVEVLYTVRDGNQKNGIPGVPADSAGADGAAILQQPGRLVRGDRLGRGPRSGGLSCEGLAECGAAGGPHAAEEGCGAAFRQCDLGGGAGEAAELGRLLASDAASETAARDRYRDLIENKPEPLACLLNIATAAGQINLRAGSPLDYLRQLIWDDSMKRDRFFAYAEPALLEQVRGGGAVRLFVPEPGSAIFHPGATASYKQVQFGEANVQITFHEDDRRTVDGHRLPEGRARRRLLQGPRRPRPTGGRPQHSFGQSDRSEAGVPAAVDGGPAAGVPEFDPLYTIV